MFCISRSAVGKAACGKHTSAKAAAARADAQVEATEPPQPNLPQLRVLKTMDQFWELWATGDRLSGTCTISRLPKSVRSQKGKKQRFSEWKQAAGEVERMVAELPTTSLGPPALQQIVSQLENELDFSRV